MPKQYAGDDDIADLWRNLHTRQRLVARFAQADNKLAMV
jgi:hypothetical protein